MNNFINLHFNSEYSFFESPTNIATYVKTAQEQGIKQLVLTDHNNVYGFAEFKSLCEKNNIKPIFGIDLNIDKYRLIFLAKNFDGYLYICKLAKEISDKEYLELATIEKSDNVFVINHPQFGFPNPEELSSRFANFFFYQDNNPKSNIFINDGRLVSNEQEESLFLINNLKEIKLNKEINFIFNKYDHKKNIDHLILETNKIAAACNVDFPIIEDCLPLLESENVNLEKSIKEGLNKYKDLLRNFPKDVVEERIKKELRVIYKMNVQNYFLIISDLVNWSKRNDIYIGPGRGSVSGSLIAFLLGITQINPLEFDLYFERFLNEERISMPDIDIDIQDDKRDLVISYLKETYGNDNVAQICTFQRMGAKQSLKDVGRFLGFSFTEINELSKLISGSDSLMESYEKNIKFKAKIQSSDLYEKLFDLSIKIESLPRQTGLHAAGIVLSRNPIINNVPVMKIDDASLATQFSMDWLENWGLLKIDLLGLRTLSIIKNIEKQIQENYDKDFSIEKVGLEDSKTNRLLLSGKVAGIFQLESPGMVNTITKVKVACFNDLVDIISLFRPGPMTNIPTYVKMKENPSSIPKISPEYDEILKSTNGIIIYQEQIMEIVQRVGGLTYAQADLLRWAISKKKKDVIDIWKNRFIEGADAQKISQSVALNIYNEIEKFAEYGFNKSHAVAYATLSYKMAFVKARYPICFYSTIISLTNSMDSVNKYVLEARELKFNIESPNVNKISYEIVHDNKNTIFLPITFVKGVGKVAQDKLVQELEANGKYTSFFNFVARAKKVGIGEAIIDILIESNSLRDFGNMNTLQNNKNSALNYANLISFENENKEIELDFNTPAPKIEVEEQDLILESKNEIKYLGMIYNAFVTSKYESQDKLFNLKEGIEYRIVLMINKKKAVMNKFKKMSYIVEVSDSSGTEAVFINEKNKDLFDAFKENSLGYATVIKTGRSEKKYLYINSWKEI